MARKRRRKVKPRLPKVIRDYNKELSRLKSRIRYHKGQGWDIKPENIIPERPEEITREDVKQLQDIRAEEIKWSSTIEEEEPIEELVTEDYIADIISHFEMLPDEFYVHDKNRRKNKVFIYPLYAQKNRLINTVWDTLNQEFDGDEQAYNKYLSTVYTDIQHDLDPENLPSDLDQLENCIAIALSLIKGRALTKDEAEAVNDYSEFMT